MIKKIVHQSEKDNLVMGSFNANSCYDQAVANMMSSNYGGLLAATFADPMRSLFGVRNLQASNNPGSNSSSNQVAGGSTVNNTGGNSGANSDHQSTISMSSVSID